MDYGEVLLLLLLSFVLSSTGRSSTPVLSSSYHIDCGASNGTTTNNGLLMWTTDDNFIDSGKNYVLQNSQSFNPMNTLRYFPIGTKNCYQFKFSDTNQKANFRAGFFYGNYDGLSRPPTFDLLIDGNLWATVTTSMGQDGPEYYEMIYRVNRDTSQVCLLQTNPNYIPFISTLEVTLMYGKLYPFMDEMYRFMEKGTALHLRSRINYGANSSVEQFIGPSEERFNRLWTSAQMSHYFNINAGGISNGSLLGENQPPWPVMEFAIQANNLSDSIYLSVDFSPQVSNVAYFVFYFLDPVVRVPQNQISKVEIFVDGVKLGATDVPVAGIYTDMYNVVSLYPVRVNSSSNIIIAPAEGSTLAPILNAMEVFSVTPVSKARSLPEISAALCLVLFHFLISMILKS